MSGFKSFSNCLTYQSVGLQKKHPTKSLEELAIIVEVLEEDLKTGNNSCSSSMSMPSPNPSLSPAQSPTGILIPAGTDPLFCSS